MKKIAVLGVGNIVQTVAVDLKVSGYGVRLSASKNPIHRFRDFTDTQVIERVDTLEARECIDIVTSDIDQAIGQADYIIVCVAGSHHQGYTQMLKGYTSAEQIMVTFNGCMAFFIYKNVRGDNLTCPIFVESTIPPFSIRLAGPGKIRMFERHLVPIAFFLASVADRYSNQIRTGPYDSPGLYADVPECGLSLINSTVHPGPCLVNLGNIEEPDFTFFLYEHSFQPSDLKIDVLFNRERLAVDKALGYQIHALENSAGVEEIDNWKPLYAMGYDHHAPTSIAGPNDTSYRYLTEDIPVTPIYWVSIRDSAGIGAPIMNAVITLIGIAHGTN